MTILTLTCQESVQTVLLRAVSYKFFFLFFFSGIQCVIFLFGAHS